MGKIEKFREILQRYADKGHERFNNALDKYEEGERSDEFYWDGYSDCAESLLKIYDSMQKEPQFRKYKCLHDYYPFGEPRSYTAGKIYDVLRDDQGVEWITNDNGHSELFGYFSNHFELVVESENKLEEIPPKLSLISPKEIHDSVCGDNRFEIIEAAKKALLEKTNIETSPNEMNVLDTFLFRCWQMKWLKQYDKTKKEEPTSKDLEAEIDEFFSNSDYFKSSFNCSTGALKPLHDAALHFAQWQKEQLMKKTCEFLYDQLNNGDMECGDIEKFIENYRNRIGM